MILTPGCAGAPRRETGETGFGRNQGAQNLTDGSREVGCASLWLSELACEGGGCAVSGFDCWHDATLARSFMRFPGRLRPQSACCTFTASPFAARSAILRLEGVVPLHVCLARTPKGELRRARGPSR